MHRTLPLLVALLLSTACATTAPPEPVPAPEPATAAQSEPLALEVIALEYADARRLSPLVSNILAPRSRDADRPATIVAETRLNALVVYGTEDQREQVKMVVAALDIAADGQRVSGK